MSTTVYLVEADSAFGNVLILDDAAREMMREGMGQRLSASWTPPRGEPSDEACDFIPTDCVFSYSTWTMLLNRRARDALGALLAPFGEFLPVLLGGYDYAWFNCWAELDAADWERCEGERRRRGNSFKTVHRYAFFPDRLVDAPAMFRLDDGSPEPFCTDALRDAVRDAGLTGFEFEAAWSSEAGGILLPPRGFDIIGTECALRHGERVERARRDMLDRMAADGATAVAIPAASRSRR